ncbi:MULTISPECIES: nuclease [unclassified Sphingomonas]|jgi:micrococcal nuclease|uniref:thermonuclease family protein n=1 Tax=unclassified Sphingomonas TaxID=196159 RepID=UPI00092B4590|nr:MULTISPECIES: nuclease [unclassified Sphingomonas]MBN8848047.1 nuclease [Sphingomonas sp.]OJV29751.1 MAG: nuclease [Sphingomonas sp. 67-36]
MAAAITVMWAIPAREDPCEGRLPSPGTRFGGVVRYVGDGDGLCIGPEGRPDQWIEIRLGDYYAPELHDPGGMEAKRELERVALGRVIACRAGRRSYDRVIGYCTLANRPLGEWLRAQGGKQGGRGWQADKPADHR